MTDIKEIYEGYTKELGWAFSYGNKANQNLLQSNLDSNEIYFLLDPITRVIENKPTGATGYTDFNGEFLLVVKSNLDAEYENKYKDNIKPLFDELDKFHKLLRCSDYEITEWSIVDVIDAFDINTDGLVVTYKVRIL